MRLLWTLICADCNQEWDLKDGSTMEMAARELGDGSVCLSCPDCGRDIAICVEESE